MGLTTLPAFKPNQLEAEVMWLNSNSIASLPTGIKQLVKLRALRLDDNQLQLMPAFLASCNGLQVRKWWRVTCDM